MTSDYNLPFGTDWLQYSFMLSLSLIRAFGVSMFTSELFKGCEEISRDVREQASEQDQPRGLRSGHAVL